MILQIIIRLFLCFGQDRDRHQRQRLHFDRFTHFRLPRKLTIDIIHQPLLLVIRQPLHHARKRKCAVFRIFLRRLFWTIELRRGHDILLLCFLLLVHINGVMHFILIERVVIELQLLHCVKL